MQTAECFSPSVDHPLRDLSVAVDAPIAEERPIAPHVFHLLQVDLADQYFFFLMAGLRNHHAERTGEERPAPELQAFSLRLVSAHVAGLEANAVYARNVDAIRYCMRPLHRPP